MTFIVNTEKRVQKNTLPDIKSGSGAKLLVEKGAKRHVKQTHHHKNARKDREIKEKF
jgi:hypothetical protein